MPNDAFEQRQLRRVAPRVTDAGHDLRTSLAVIRIQAQMLIRLTERRPDDERDLQERYLVGLRRIDHAVTSINDVLDRIDIDGLVGSPTPLELPCDDRHGDIGGI